jgi:hypothetical protein
MKKAFLLSIIFFTTLIAVAQRQKQVWLGGLQRTHLAQDENVHRVYFDKWGNLYPDVALHIPYKAFFDYKKTGNTYKENDNTGNLDSFYTQHQPELELLAKHYGVALNTDPQKTFEAAEAAIVKRNAESINQLLSKQPSKTLVVFIHGFNDPDPTGDYQQAIDAIKKMKYEGYENFIYLEVFWDGLTSNQGDPSTSGIWGRAQKNGSNVSIGLRELLFQINSEAKMRVITHSHGAGVITAALFNTNEKWHHKNKEYLSFSEKTDVPKQPDIRVGMIAAAIPGVTTFSDFNYRGKGTIQNKDNNISRIIVGFNRDDYAVTKHAFGRDNAGILGATSLGCDYDNEIQKSRKVLFDKFHYTQPETASIIQQENFSNDGPYKKEHGLYYYMIQEKHFESFLDKLFK